MAGGFYSSSSSGGGAQRRCAHGPYKVVERCTLFSLLVYPNVDCAFDGCAVLYWHRARIGGRRPKSRARSSGTGRRAIAVGNHRPSSSFFFHVILSPRHHQEYEQQTTKYCCLFSKWLTVTAIRTSHLLIVRVVKCRLSLLLCFD